MREPQALLASRRKYEADGWYTCRSLRHKCAVGALSFSKRVLSRLSLSLSHTHTHTYISRNTAGRGRACSWYLHTAHRLYLCGSAARPASLLSAERCVERAPQSRAAHECVRVWGESSRSRSQRSVCESNTHSGRCTRGGVCAQ